MTVLDVVDPVFRPLPPRFRMGVRYSVAGHIRDRLNLLLTVMEYNQNLIRAKMEKAGKYDLEELDFN